MQLTKELFVIPNNGTFFLYAPLKGAVMEVNPDMVQLLKRIENGGPVEEELEDRLGPLIEKGILVESEEQYPKEEIPDDFRPTKVTLMPTSDCNLRCVYCYGNGGIDPSNMTEEVSDATIDFLIGNALEKGKEKIHIGLHGGGEPLLWSNWDLITHTVGRARDLASKNNLEISFSSATNGVLNQKQLEWVIDNLDNLMVSMDGPEDIQNLQRPAANGNPTYEAVMRTIRFLEDKEAGYGIRATITEESVERMAELVDFFHEITSLKSVHLEPLSECGRCHTSKWQAPEPITYLNNLIKAVERGREYGIKVNYSARRLGSVSKAFCGAAGRNFCVTPEGNLTTCYEVTRPDDKRRKIFFYGAFNGKGFDVDMGKLRALASRTVDNIPYCLDCFAKYNCAGDCLAKVEMGSGDMFDPSANPRCVVNRGILKYEISNKLRGGMQNG